MIEDIIDEIFDVESILSKEDFEQKFLENCNWLLNSATVRQKLFGEYYDFSRKH